MQTEPTKMVLLVCGLALASAGAHAQCDPVWDATIGMPGVAGVGYIQPMVFWDDGSGEKLFAGGSAENLGGNSAIDFIGAYDTNTNTWSALGAGIDAGPVNAFITKIFPWDDGSGEKLYVSGQFSTAGGMSSANSFAAWNGTSWESLGAEFTDSDFRVIYDALPLDLDGNGEKLYLAGGFFQIGDVPNTNGLAIYDGSSYTVWGNGTGLPFGQSAFIGDLQEFDDGSGNAIYACGRFSSIDGVTATNVARYNIASGQWEAFGEELVPDRPFYNNFKFTVFDDGTGPALYLAGWRFRIGGAGDLYSVAKWDGQNWTGVGTINSGRVNDITVFDDGSGPALYVGCSLIDGVNNFAKYDGTDFVTVADGVGGPSTSNGSPSVFGLYPVNDSLYVGGSYTTVDGSGTSARGVAVLHACDDSDCVADTNGDGNLDGSDFSAWINAFNNNLPECDQNGDGACTPGDFSAWINNYNAGCP